MSEQRVTELKAGEAQSEEVNEMITESEKLQGDSTLQGIVARKPEIFEGFSRSSALRYEAKVVKSSRISKS